MAIQEKELQLISVQRSGGDKGNRMASAAGRYPTTGRTAGTTAERRRRRHQKKRLRRIRGISMLLLAVCCLLGIGWVHSGMSAKFSAVRQTYDLQKMKKEEYPQELMELLERNEETLDFVKNYPNREKYRKEDIDLSGDYSENDSSGEVPLLIQWDKRWGYDLYGESMIALSGCGPTCLSMANIYFTGDLTANPKKMAEFASANGYCTSEGTSWSLWTEGVEQLGLHGEMLSLSEGIMENTLDAGGLIVCSMRPGDFTTTGHFILIRGYDEKGFFVNDPNSKNNSKKQWNYDVISPQIKNLWALYP